MALAFVQSNSAAITSGSGLPVTWSSNPTNGNLIVVAIANNLGATVSSITDSETNAYVRAVANNFGSYNLEVWYSKNITGGPTPTITATMSDTGHAVICCFEYSGADKTAPLDVTSSNTNDPRTGASSAADSGSFITNYSQEIIFGAAATTQNVFSAGASFGDLTQTGSGLFIRGGAEDRIVTSVGNYSASFTLTSDNWTCAMATFKADASAGTTTSTSSSTSSTSSSTSISSTSSSTSMSTSSSTSTSSTSLSSSTSSTSHSTSSTSSSTSRSFTTSTSSTSSSSSTSMSSTSTSSTSTSSTTTVIDSSLIPSGSITPQPHTATAIDGYPTVLVDDPNYLVDDPRALTGSPVTTIGNLKLQAQNSQPQAQIKPSR